MPIGTPFHPRVAALCESMAWRDWAGFHAVSCYEATHEREYNAIRQAAALIDISPLFKYRVSGKDAARLVDRVVTRDVPKMAVGQVAYTHWCDARGKVIDDGTVSRLAPDVFRWTAAEPTLRWMLLNAVGLDAKVEDISDRTAALAVQGPTSRALLAACTDGDVASLKYFRVMPAAIRGVPVEISRTGYTGDLGYEVWMPAERALEVWDTLMDVGRAYDVTPTGIWALDVARIEAGLIMLDVDYVSAKKALVPSQEYSPWEIGLGRLVNLKKGPFVGRRALAAEEPREGARRLVGLEVDWTDLERLYEQAGLTPAISPVASRASVPVFDDGLQVGKATSTTWSPTLKKLIALATVERGVATAGRNLKVEHTVDHVRRQVEATVHDLPFFDPPRKRG